MKTVRHKSLCSMRRGETDGWSGRQTDTAKVTVTIFAVALRTNQKVDIDLSILKALDCWLRTRPTAHTAALHKEAVRVSRCTVSTRPVPSRTHNIGFKQLSTAKHSLSKRDWLWGPTSILLGAFRGKPDADQSHSTTHRVLLRIATVAKHPK